MQTLETIFSPSDGSPLQTITLRLGAPHHTDMGWAVFVEIVGFDEPYGQAIYGEDWAQAIELAARILPIALEQRVDEAGGGALEPAFFTRPPSKSDLSDLPPEIARAFSNSSTTDD